jgi:catechol 2,3-dioxygenase-like lactoylglutathione lyase family enzyme
VTANRPVARIASIIYRDVLGLKVIFGGEEASFSSLCLGDGEHTILNLEEGKPVNGWGRVIFYLDDVDACWLYLKGKGFDPERPRDAPWGERYFHILDPDGHELSFARPLERKS